MKQMNLRLDISILIYFVTLLLQIKFNLSYFLTSPQVIDYSNSNNLTNGIYTISLNHTIPHPVIDTLKAKWPFSPLNINHIDTSINDNQCILYVIQSARTNRYYWALFHSQDYIANGFAEHKMIFLYNQDGKQFAIINGASNITDVSSYSFPQITYLETLYADSGALDKSIAQCQVGEHLTRTKYPYDPQEYEVSCWTDEHLLDANECAAIEGRYTKLAYNEPVSLRLITNHLSRFKQLWNANNLTPDVVRRLVNGNGYYLFYVPFPLSGNTPNYKWAIVKDHILCQQKSESSDAFTITVDDLPAVVVRNVGITNQGFNDLWVTTLQLKRLQDSRYRELEKKKALIQNKNVFIHANKTYPGWSLYVLLSLSVGFVLMMCGVIMPKIVNCICEFEEPESHKVPIASKMLPSVPVTGFRLDYNLPEAPQQLNNEGEIAREGQHQMYDIPQHKPNKVVIPDSIANNI